MKCSILSARCAKRLGFSLVEVVIALGVIAVAVLAILAVFPAALQTGHSAQDETRAAQIAQTIFPSLAGQAVSQFNNVQFLLSDNSTRSTPPVDLTLSSGATPAVTLYAENDGKLTQNATKAVLRVAWPANAPAANQTYRDYVRIISKY